MYIKWGVFEENKLFLKEGDKVHFIFVFDVEWGEICAPKWCEDGFSTNDKGGDFCYLVAIDVKRELLMSTKSFNLAS